MKSKTKKIIVIITVLSIVLSVSGYYYWHKTMIDDRMEYELHEYYVNITSNASFDLIIPIAINGTLETSNGISYVMNNIKTIEGNANKSFIKTPFGFGMSISGKGKVEFSSSYKSKYYYDYYTSERHILEGTPIDTSVCLSLGKIYSSNNNSLIYVFIQYSTSTTCEVGGSYLTSWIKSNVDWVDWGNISIITSQISAP